ncbi:hypothetical protein DEO72_LG11g1015 [Vigna unguiculata]|uniref:Uncharacterized protein n=1 Tax=Vigna unguiculata TaxID=3917 RepID=A0A4D6NQD1_VIGUN|nr:hypothetical protein DEO72_LG11g1015 [Vigna unguiculata]
MEGQWLREDAFCTSFFFSSKSRGRKKDPLAEVGEGRTVTTAGDGFDSARSAIGNNYIEEMQCNGKKVERIVKMSEKSRC